MSHVVCDLETFLSFLPFRRHVIAVQQDPMSAAAAEKHLAMIAPFCTFECLILDFILRYAGGCQGFLCLVNEICCQVYVPRLIFFMPSKMFYLLLYRSSWRGDSPV